MKKVIMIIIIFLVPVYTSTTASWDSNNFVKFSVYDNSLENWISLQISSDSYTLYENEEIIREIKFLTNPWDTITYELNKANFFDNNIEEENPHTIIEASLGSYYNNQSISHVNIQPERLTIFFMSILERVKGLNYNIWPLDTSISVMESYPEQYNIEVIFQRANDLLAVVKEENATLFVTTSNPFSSEFHTVNTLVKESVTVTINSGNGNTCITFPTFTGSTKFRDIHFTIMMDSGVYLYQRWNDTMPIIGDNGVTILDVNDTGNQMVDTPSSWLVIIAVPILQIYRRRKE